MEDVTQFEGCGSYREMKSIAGKREDDDDDV